MPSKLNVQFTARQSARLEALAAVVAWVTGRLTGGVEGDDR
jgi:hypothetical protein